MKKFTLLITCIFCFATFLEINGQDRSIEILMKDYQELKQVQGSVLDYFTNTEVKSIQNYLLSNGTPEVINNNYKVGTISYGTEAATLGYGSFDTDVPGDFTVISAGSGTVNFEGAGAIDPTNNTSGYMVDSGGIMYSFDVFSGVFTNLGSFGLPGGLSGMEYDEGGTLYAIDATNLYIIDPSGPSATLIGPLGTAGGAGLAIALAIDNTGTGYTYDLTDDSAYSIDLATGLTTLLGSIGFDANFGQGMYYDPLSDTIFLAAFNNAAFAGQLRTLDKVTGNTTLIGVLATDSDPAQLGWCSVQGGAIENFVCAEALKVGLGTTNVADGIDNSAGGSSNICLSGATNSIWFKYTAGSSGDLTISSDLPGSTSADTRVSVYNNDCAALVCIDSDDNSGTNNSSLVNISVVSGTTYLIEWDDANDNSAFDFELSLDIFCPDPENFMLVSATDISADFSWDAVAEATNGYLFAVFAAGADPDVDPPVYEEIIPAGTTTATATGLEGTTLYDAYLTADCDTDGFSNDLKISFTTVPANDALCNATALIVDADCTGAIYTNVDASVQTGEPEGDCFVGGPQATVWFSFVAPDNGSVLISTDLDAGVATNTDTEIALYAAPTDCLDLTTLSPALACDQDSGVDITFNSILETTGLVPGDTYYIQVSGYNGTEGTFCIIVQEGPDCPAPENFVLIATTETTADFSWDPVANATTGYTLRVFSDGDDPTTDTPIYTEDLPAGTVSTTATGLTSGTSYDAYLNADCDVDGLSDLVMIDFSTSFPPPTCGGKFYDTGGPDGDFMNDENYTVTILPDNPGDLVTATFVFVNNTTFDILTVDIGDGVSQIVPEIPAGSPPVAYTSIAADGSLFFTFMSSTVVPNAGWDADITCDPPLGIDDLNNVGFSYYPNPTTNTLLVKANQPIEAIALYNILGQQVLEIRPDALEVNLDLSSLSSATYVMKSIINGNTYSHKVIKK